MTEQEIFEKTFARIKNMIRVGASTGEMKETPFMAGARFVVALNMPGEFFKWIVKEIVKQGKKVEDIKEPDKLFIYWLEKIWLK